MRSTTRGRETAMTSVEAALDDALGLDDEEGAEAEGNASTKQTPKP